MASWQYMVSHISIFGSIKFRSDELFLFKFNGLFIQQNMIINFAWSVPNWARKLIAKTWLKLTIKGCLKQQSKHVINSLYSRNSVVWFLSSAGHAVDSVQEVILRMIETEFDSEALSQTECNEWCNIINWELEIILRYFY